MKLITKQKTAARNLSGIVREQEIKKDDIRSALHRECDCLACRSTLDSLHTLCVQCLGEFLGPNTIKVDN